MTRDTRNKYILYISDPWDFGTQHGNGPFTVSLADWSGDAEKTRGQALIELDRGLEFKGVRFRSLVATTRHSEEGFEALEEGHEVAVNLTPVADDLTVVSECFESAKKWRGWVLIGSLSTALT